MKVYKVSNKFNPLKLLIMIIGIAVAAAVLSVVYLLAIKLIPIVYVDAVLAVGVGFGVGAAASLLTKIYKIRSPIVAALAAVIAVALSGGVKWAVYAEWDNKQYTNYIKDSGVVWLESMFELKDNFNKVKISNTETVSAVIEEMKQTTAYNYKTKTNKIRVITKKKEQELAKAIQEKYAENPHLFEEMKTKSYFDFMDYGMLLGDSTEKIIDNLKNSKRMNITEYYKSVMLKNAPRADIQAYVNKMYGANSTFDSPEDTNAVVLLTHPGILIDNIKRINEQGRWSLNGSHTGVSNDINVVNGSFLLFIWVLEFLCIAIPAAVMSAVTASKPFIEKYGVWAKSYKTAIAFEPMDQILSEKIKNDHIAFLETKPFSLLGMDRSYDGIILYHSNDFTENYITVMRYKFELKARKYYGTVKVKYMFMNKEDIYRLHRHCGLKSPFNDAEIRQTDTVIYPSESGERQMPKMSTDKNSSAGNIVMPDFMDMGRVAQLKERDGR